MNNKTVLITGATQGIGFELSKLFAQDGYSLVLVARNEQKLNDIRKSFKAEYDVGVRIIAKDLSRPDSAQEIFEQLKLENTIVNILINNAGFGHLGEFTETDWEVEQQMIQLNITTLTQLTKLFLPDMLDLNQGAIMNVASTAAFMPGPLMSVYYATKAYVFSFSQALANELKDTNITVNTLCPGATDTEFARVAEMDNSKLFSSSLLSVMDAKTVARMGYKDLMNGKELTITGAMNKMLVQSVRVSPRKMVMNITRWLMDKRG
jgi:short-subunit dehydrogenase